VQTWCERYAAHACLVAMLGPIRRWDWQSHTLVVGRHGISAECHALERLADFVPNDEESTWTIPEPYSLEIERFVRKAYAR
jgi:hypothetical protein